MTSRFVIALPASAAFISKGLFRHRSCLLTSTRKFMANPLDSIPAADIDSGRFKYVLIRVDYQDPQSGKELNKVIVRGYSWAAFHADIYDKVQEELSLTGLDTECLGGGRILHDAAAKSIHVYGYSQGFGLADHDLAVKLLKERYPDYPSITWANEGY